MTTIVKRTTKGTPLTHAELDANFDNLNTYKVEQNAAGNVGLGVTPSSWVSGRALELGTAGNALWGFSGSIVLSQNTAGYSTNFLYATNAAASRYQQVSGQHQWYTAPAGPAGTSIPFITPAMTLDANGNLGVGGTPSQRLHVFGAGSVNPTVESSGSTTGQVGWNLKNNVASTATFSIYNSTQAAFGAVGSGEAFLYANSPGLTICTDTAGAPIKFATGTSNAERMRITSAGYVNIGTGANNPNNRALFVKGVIGISANGTTEAGKWYSDGTLAYLDSGSTGQVFYTGNAERVRIDTSGNLLVGATAAINTERVRIESTASGSIPNTLRLTNSGTAAGTGVNLSFLTYTNATSPVTIASISGIATDTAGNGAIAFNASGAERMRIDASGNVLVTGSGGLGYGTGSGGTVTQTTSKTSTVVLNKPTGQITMNNAALAANTTALFSFSNTLIGPSDTVVVNLKGGYAASGSYQVWVDGVGTGTCGIALRNISGGSLSEAVVLNFAIIKGATS